MQVDATQSAKGLSCVNEDWELWGSELGVSQSPPSRLPPRVVLCHCAWNPEETALNTAFLLLHAGRSADKIGTRLEGQWERNFHSGACRHLRAYPGVDAIGLSLIFPYWKSPSLGTRVSGSQVFTNLPAAKVSHTPQGSVSHLLDDRDWTCSRTFVLD